MNFHKKKSSWPPVIKGLIGLAGALLICYIVYLLPPVNERLGWRVEYAGIYLKGMINPVAPMPTPAIVNTPVIKGATPTQTLPTETIPANTETVVPTPTFTPSPTPIPAKVAPGFPGV